MFVHPHFVYLDMQTEWTLKNITFTWLTQIPTRWWWIVLQTSSVNNNVSSLIVGLFPILGKENKSRAITLKLRGPCQKPTFLGPNDHFCGCIANKTKPKTISGHFEINKCSKTSISSYFSHSPSQFPYSPCLSLTHYLPVKHPVHVIKKKHRTPPSGKLHRHFSLFPIHAPDFFDTKLQQTGHGQLFLPVWTVKQSL